jgi:hypothetical protein
MWRHTKSNEATETDNTREGRADERAQRLYQTRFCVEGNQDYYGGEVAQR